MTITLNFKPEPAARLSAQAKAKGMTVEQYVLSAVESVVIPVPQKALSPEEWAAELKAWSESHRSDAPLLSDYAVSRESIYEDRGL